MRAITLVLAILATSLALGGEAWAQYNLRTVPTVPQAGASFVAAFDGNECEVFMVSPPGAPPVVSVQGSTVRLEVDRVTVGNCGGQIITHTLSIPALAQGSYQLELVARAFGSPGNNSLVQVVTFGVVPASTLAPFTIPATDPWALALFLAGTMCLGFRRR